MRAWDRLLVIVLLVAIASVSVWDAQRVQETWLRQRASITVYFVNEDATGLVAESRQVRVSDDLLRATLEQLIRGPENPKLSQAIPSGTRILETRLDGSTAYVSFSHELRTQHWGGSTGEIMTVYAIVNSLTALPGVDRVLILLEGRYEETLVGHLILDEAFERNESLIHQYY